GNVNLGSGTLTIDGAASTTYSGVISDGGNAGSLVVSLGSANTLTLANVSTYTGGTTVNSGTLQLNVANALSSSGPLTVNGTGTGPSPVPAVDGTVQLNGNNLAVGDLSGTGRYATVANTTGGAATLTLNTSGYSTYGGTLSDTASTPLSLVMAGSGTELMSGESVIHGGVDIQGGTLRINGSLDDSQGTGIKVENGASLHGVGTIYGSIAVMPGGTYGPGNSPGTQNISTLTLSGGSGVEFDTAIATSTYNDQTHTGTYTSLANINSGGGNLVVDSSVTAASPVVVSVESYATASPSTMGPLTLQGGVSGSSNFNPNGSYQWEYITFTGSYINNSTGDLSLNQIFTFNSSSITEFVAQNPGALLSDFSVSMSGNVLYIDYGPSAVPEPGSMLLAAIAAMGAAGFGWRRRRQTKLEPDNSSQPQGGEA
ncbi:MAG TPA: autotransporter-associated beta strand repeat-containing protein, partial [Pirellulales bacterium]